MYTCSELLFFWMFLFLFLFRKSPTTDSSPKLSENSPEQQGKEINISYLIPAADKLETLVFFTNQYDS